MQNLIQTNTEKLPPLNIENTPHEVIDVDDSGTQRIKLSLPPILDSEFPTVSIVTPTYNRKDFIDLMIRNWIKIDYPRYKLEWIIVDDSETIESYNILKSKLIENFGIMGQNNNKTLPSYIRLIRENRHLNIGEKRNYLASLARNSYIVHLDDDDFYPSVSVAARIRALLQFEEKIGELGCIGCTKVLCYDLVTNQTYESFDRSCIYREDQNGNKIIEYSNTPSTISESSLVYSKKYWETRKFNDMDNITECLNFIKDRTNTLCNIPSSYVITQLTHMKNTVNRRMNQRYLKEHNVVSNENGSFMNTLVVSDSNLINNLRANVISQFPEWNISREFVAKYNNATPSKLKKKLKEFTDKHGVSILKNPLITDLRQRVLATKKSSTGKELVYYCGPGKYFNFTQKWNPESRTLGGSEEAIINLTKQLASRGWDITIYCVLDGDEKTYYDNSKIKKGGVKYRHYWNWIPGNKTDVTIIWRDPSILDMYEINSNNVILDLHDAIDPTWLQNIGNDYKNLTIAVKSRFHKKILNLDSFENGGVVIIPNGISTDYKINNSKNYKINNNSKISRIPNSLLCTSSPDRCIRALLRAIPIIRKEVPGAEIYWAYGFKAGVTEGGMEKDSRPEVSNWVQESKQLIKQTEGFNDLGRLSQDEIKEWYRKTDIFAYGTTFPEIECISLTKAMASGLVPVVTPAGAMAEKIGNEDYECSKIGMGTLLNIDSSLKEGQDFDVWVKNIVHQLKNSEREKEREKLMLEAYNKYNWKIITDKWIKIF